MSCAADCAARHHFHDAAGWDEARARYLADKGPRETAGEALVRRVEGIIEMYGIEKRVERGAHV